MKRILIVEDEINTAKGLAELLEMWGYRACGTAQSGEDALNAAHSERPDAVLMDVKMRGKMDEIEAGRLINSQLGIPVIIMTAYYSPEMERLKETKKIQYINKPFDLEQLQSMLAACLDD
ncbi:MAG: response regulator [Actinomycetota bacterium]|nr:response regulator [Nitrospiraceae bacterium]MDA8157201.1 response regulator [Actinomycetota bacterium]